MELDLAGARFEAILKAVKGLMGAAQSAVGLDCVAKLIASGQVGEELSDLLAKCGRGHRGGRVGARVVFVRVHGGRHGDPVNGYLKERLC